MLKTCPYYGRMMCFAGILSTVKPTMIPPRCNRRRIRIRTIIDYSVMPIVARHHAFS